MARLPCQRNYAKPAAQARSEPPGQKPSRLGHTLPFGDDGMADHAEVQYASATGNDYPAHEHTYRSFVTLVKVSLAVIVVVLILMAFFLT
jgi:aa3 type cytochrome c oxidase subunit IV